VLRSQPKGICNAVFLATEAAFPPTIRNVPFDVTE
jgi:hypothetical protein